MLLEQKERAWIKYHYWLLETTMEKIKKLELAGEDSEELDEQYDNMFMWADAMSTKVKELWDNEY